MKVEIKYVRRELFFLTAFEPGDEPADAVDVPPFLVNQWQKAELARQHAVDDILEHLKENQ